MKVHIIFSGFFSIFQLLVEHSKKGWEVLIAGSLKCSEAMITVIFTYDDRSCNDKNSTVAQKFQLTVILDIRYQITYSFFIAGYILLKQQTNAVKAETDLFQLCRQWIWRIYFNIDSVDISFVRTALLNWIFWTSQSIIILWIF